MLQALNRFADRLIGDATDRAVPKPPIPIIIGDDDDDDELVDDELGTAEGQFFMIDYRDARGRVTSRRVTVFGIQHGVGLVPLLRCRCHERRAQRSFRVDRILTCYDADGVVYDDVPSFLAETFGLGIAVASRKEGTAAQNAWSRIRACVKPHAVLLAALSRSDATMRDDEVAVAVEHCRSAASICGFIVEDHEIALLERYIRRQRPTRDNIFAACETMREENPETIRSFLASAVELMDADGRRHPEEIDLLNDVSMEMTGVPLV